MKMCFAFLLVFISANLFSQTVYATPSGTKYHLSSCRMVKNVSKSLTVEKALQNGLLPCNICHPPFRTGIGIVSVPKKTSGVNSRNQCKGTTNAGTRCKHFTRIGNDYCFQHQK